MATMHPCIDLIADYLLMLHAYGPLWHGQPNHHHFYTSSSGRPVGCMSTNATGSGATVSLVQTLQERRVVAFLVFWARNDELLAC
jgi:hypothetical protein